MIFKIALRNLARSIPRRALLVGIISGSIALMLVANTIFENTDKGLEDAYKNSFTGELSVSQYSPESFNIFGSEVPLVGEYLSIPLLGDFATIQVVMEKESSIEAVVPMVSSAGSVAIEGFASTQVLFGVELDRYLQSMSGLRLIHGNRDQVPRGSGKGIILGQTIHTEITTALGRELVPNEPLTLRLVRNGSFILREVPYKGTFAYPISDELLARVSLVDVNTARALNGYTIGSVSSSDNSEPVVEDDPFANAQDVVGGTGDSVDLAALEAVLLDNTLRDQALEPLDGAWNFLIIRLKDGASEFAVRARLQTTMDQLGSQAEVRTWRTTAGGSAEIVSVIRILFNGGMIFIAVATGLIIINSLSLSMQERLKEFGTMRAMGAPRSFIATMVGMEIFILMALAGLMGVLLGIGGLLYLEGQDITFTNTYLKLLMGGGSLDASISLSQNLLHIFFSFLLGFFAMVNPLRIALKVSPIKAITKE